MTKRSGPPRKTAKPAKAAPWLPDLPSREDRKRVAGGHPPPPKPAAKAGAKAPARPQPSSRAQPSAGAGAPRGPASRPQPRPHARIAIDDPFASRESQRYDQPIASREAIIAFLAERTELMTAERVAQELGLDRTRPLRCAGQAPLRDGARRPVAGEPPRRLRRGAQARPDSRQVIANAEGYGFLRPDDGGDDLFLSPAQMRQVLHGDRVLASVVGRRPSRPPRGRDRRGARAPLAAPRRPLPGPGRLRPRGAGRTPHPPGRADPGRTRRRGAQRARSWSCEITEPPEHAIVRRSAA